MGQVCFFSFSWLKCAWRIHNKESKKDIHSCETFGHRKIYAENPFMFLLQVSSCIATEGRPAIAFNVYGIGSMFLESFAVDHFRSMP